MSLNHWLNAAIVIACIGILISLSDFILSPTQKKKVDNFIDGLTLRLDYTKTLDWLQRWLRASRRASIVEIFFGIVSVVSTLAVIVAVEWLLWDDTPWWMLIGVGFITLFFWVWQWGYVSKAYEKVGVPIIAWLAARDSYRSLVEAYLS